MNKVFPIMQRKDKDLSTGQYTHATQETGQIPPMPKNRWLLPVLCMFLIALAVLASLVL